MAATADARPRHGRVLWRLALATCMDADQPDGRPGLALLSLSNKPEFDAAFAALAQPISDYSFACAFSWGQAMGLYFARLDRHLCLFANGSDLTMLLPPIAEPGATAEDLSRCLTQAFVLMDAWNKDHGGIHQSRIEYVSDEMLERIRAVTGGTNGSLQLSASPMGGDYIYPVGNMIDLPGGDLKSKRGAKNRFIRENPNHRAELMRPEHIPLCLELLNRWRSHGDDVHQGQVTIDAEAKDTSDLRRRDQIACTTAVEMYEQLGLKGLVLFVGDKLVGFTLGESLSPSQSSVMFEKTDPDYNVVA